MARNHTFDQLALGESATIRRTCTAADLVVFAHASGNHNPMNLPGKDVDGDGVVDTVAPSLWVGSLVSAVLGNLLPGAGTLYKEQNFRFLDRAHIGDELSVTVTLKEKREKPLAVFDTRVTRGDGVVVLEGEALVLCPTLSLDLPDTDLPPLLVDEMRHFDGLIEKARTLPPLVTAVVCPDDKNSLGGALLSREQGLIDPILIGNPAKIHAAAAALGKDISGIPLLDVADPVAAAARAIALVNEGGARAVMKGNIHSDELLAQIIKKEGGLRGNRRISHTFVMDAPTTPQLLLISDAAINIAPDLATKIDIVQNAIDLARACGLETPRVGILSAVETVNPNIPSTLDAAILSKMAERGQIKGGIVDGPLAMDNAIDVEAARTKGIRSLVAGHAEVLIVPNLEAGNMLAKELTFIARAECAGLVLGAKVPVMLTSRADNDKARLASCAIAQLYDFWRREGRAVGAAEAPLAKAAE